jgi:hypothetical protein
MRGEGGFDGYFWEGFVIEGDSVLFRWRYIYDCLYLNIVWIVCDCVVLVAS